ncbi:Hypothetical protein DPCES_5386 [Desulfitobacterium hafniense]|uniref:Uncharacterized protein n=1 Tax=Desulfitobacterium hafniense TaxID=49338 RepID=A0A098AUA0_DESHA|nr:hypothetical protein [Desulfitobacterium hafniense]CDV96384.1 Hypothetical protein DPCES_5386 [Desulfitobacterium hafniense]
MKTPEMIKALAENPELMFEHKKGDWKRVVRISNNGYFYLDIYKNDELIPDSLGGGGFNGNVNAEYEWELVRVPVDFMTAIKAYAEGKKIRVVWGSDERIYGTKDKAYPILDNRGEGISVEEILNGVWFVED